LGWINKKGICRKQDLDDKAVDFMISREAERSALDERFNNSVVSEMRVVSLMKSIETG